MAKKCKGQPAPVWREFMSGAMKRLADSRSFDKQKDTWTQIGEEIVRAGDGEKFLKSCRRGRATQRQNGRYQIMRVVEAAVGAGVPRRREDRNTPEAEKRNGALEIHQDKS